MKETKDFNLEELKNYLKKNGLDEALANSPVLVQKFSDKTQNAKTSIRKEGKTILVEQLSKKQKKVHYLMDDPIGGDSIENTIAKVTYYLDENGETELAKETIQKSSLNHEVSETDLYSESAEANYEINEEGLKDKNPSDYPLIIMISKVSQLQNNVKNLTQENEKQRKMLEKSLSFAQTVRDSRVGRLFFGKKAKEVLGEKNKNAKPLPEGRDEI